MNTQTKSRLFTPTPEEIQAASEDYVGFCRLCGAERDCCEPDACGYECEECGKPTVYGAEEFVLRGWVK